MKPNVFAALASSRKSIVGACALVLIAGVYFFGPGAWAEKSVVLTTIAGIAVSIINAIGKEDAAAKGAPAAPDPVTIPIAFDADDTIPNLVRPK